MAACLQGRAGLPGTAWRPPASVPAGRLTPARPACLTARTCTGWRGRRAATSFPWIPFPPHQLVTSAAYFRRRACATGPETSPRRRARPPRRCHDRPHAGARAEMRLRRERAHRPRGEQCFAPLGMTKSRQVDRHEMRMFGESQPGGLESEYSLRPGAQQQGVIVAVPALRRSGSTSRRWFGTASRSIRSANCGVGR